MNSHCWPGRVAKMLSNIRLPDFLDFERCENIDLIAVCDTALITFKHELSAYKVNIIQARTGRGSNKLRRGHVVADLPWPISERE